MQAIAAYGSTGDESFNRTKIGLAIAPSRADCDDSESPTDRTSVGKSSLE